MWLGVFCTAPFLLTIWLLLERGTDLLVSTFERVLSIFSTRKRHIRATGHRKHRSRFRRTPFMPSLLILPSSWGNLTHTVGLSAWFCAMHHYLTHFITPTMVVVHIVQRMRWNLRTLFARLWPRLPPDRSLSTMVAYGLEYGHRVWNFVKWEPVLVSIDHKLTFTLITTVLMGTGTCGLIFAGGNCIARRTIGGIRGVLGILLALGVNVVGFNPLMFLTLTLRVKSCLKSLRETEIISECLVILNFLLALVMWMRKVRADWGLLDDPLDSGGLSTCAQELNGSVDVGNTPKVDFDLRSTDMFCQSVGSFPSNGTNPVGYMGSRDAGTATESSSGRAARAMACTATARPSVQLVVDTGATRTSTSNREDFVTFTASGLENKQLDGIAEGLKIEGEGVVEYVVQMDDGVEYTITSDAFYVPALDRKTRLLSPQATDTKEGHKVSFTTHTNRKDPSSFAELKVIKDQPEWQFATPLSRLTVPYDRYSNLPIITGTFPGQKQRFVKALAAAIDVTEEGNKNLSADQKELLRWHFRLGHVGMGHLQWMIRSGKVPVRNQKGVANCERPKCAACEYGKATKRPTATGTNIPNPDKEMNLKQNHLQPGQCVSVDHYQSAVPGRLYTSKGGTDPRHMFHGGAIFVDHASGYLDVRHQVTLGAADSVKSKLQFEREAFTSGVVMQSYHTDNGVFTSNGFMEELLSSNQRIRFSGVGAAHQAGVAERGIRTVVDMARTMMLHTALHAPDLISAELWPMAMDHAVWLYNRIPRRGCGATPLEIWSRSTHTPTRDILGNSHVWGCPVFVLEPKLQKGNVKIPKWAPRSRQGLNMGFSRLHSSLVGLVLNLSTKSISAQFHVVFDDYFSTVPTSGGTIDQTSWLKLITFPSARLRYIFDETDDPCLADEWLTPDEAAHRQQQRRQDAVK